MHLAAVDLRIHAEVAGDTVVAYTDGLVERPAVLSIGSFGDVEKPVARRRHGRRIAEVAPVHP